MNKDGMQEVIIVISFESKRIYDAIRSRLVNANKEIKIAVCWMRVSVFKDIFISKAQHGIPVHIILDDNESNRSQDSEIQELLAAGVKINFLSMSSEKNHMHEKMAIIDKKFLLIGSYNWSYNANKNFESIVITDDKDTVEHALIEFDEIMLYVSNMKVMMKKAYDKKYGELTSVLYEDYSESHGGSPEYNIHLIQFDKNRNKVSDRIIMVYPDSMIEEVYPEDGVYDFFDRCLQLISETGLKHSIDGILKYETSHELTPDGECMQEYVAIWKNRFTEVDSSFFDEGHFDFL